MNIQELQLVAGVILKLGETGYAAFLCWLALQALGPILWFVGALTCVIYVIKGIVLITVDNVTVMIRDHLRPGSHRTSISSYEREEVFEWVRKNLK